MSLIELILHNLRTRPARFLFTSLAVAIGVMTVVALGILTFSLRETAVSVLRTGNADFSVAQKGVSDVLYSSVDAADLRAIRAEPEVESAIGVLVAITKLDADHPLFLQIGIDPSQLTEFGVRVVAGRAYSGHAGNEIMLGFRIAADLGSRVGDTLTVDGVTYRVVGIFSTGQVFGDSAAMLPLPVVQANERKPGAMTLIFVRVKRGSDVDAVRTRIESQRPQLASVRTQSEFGRVDRNLELISAANLGGSILAIVIGAFVVMNTTLLSFFERTREFGVLRALGWSPWRLLSLVAGEAAVVCLFGAALGVGLGLLAVRLLQQVPELTGVLDPKLTIGVFGRALLFAFVIGFAGALYPAIRAARLSPIAAVRHE